MATTETGKKSMVIALDGHKLGHITGAMAGFVVMSLSLYFRNADAFTTFTRVGWTFVVAYGSMFFLVRVILRTTLAQLALEKRVALQEKRERHREQRRGERGDDARAETDVDTEPESGLEAE